jgi:hypothetical protein
LLILQATRKDIDTAIAIFEELGSRIELGWTLVSQGEAVSFLSFRPSEPGERAEESTEWVAAC